VRKKTDTDMRLSMLGEVRLEELVGGKVKTSEVLDQEVVLRLMILGMEKIFLDHPDVLDTLPKRRGRKKKK
jgi:hypothetical protein